MNKRKFGIIGEKIVQRYLINKGYNILKTNFYTKIGELDIIAKKNKCIIFIEVKTRCSLEYGSPAMAVNTIKQKNIKNTAKIFLHINKLYKYDVRFDVVEVYISNGKCKINHIEGAI